MSTAFKLRNGTILLTTEAPGGIYNAAQLKKIASLCESESAIVKATEDHRLALCVKPEMAGGISEQLKAIGLGVRHYQDGLHQPISCIGELCPENEQDALGSALDLSQVLNQVTLASPLKIGINGCAKCCVPCHTLDISIVGDLSGYRISLGGKSSQLPELAIFMAEGVPPNELPGLIQSVVELYKAQAEEGESLQSVLDRIGTADFIRALAPYSQDAASTGDPFENSEQNSLANQSTETVDEIDSTKLEDASPEPKGIEPEDSYSEVDGPDLSLGDLNAEFTGEDQNTMIDIDPHASTDIQDFENEVEISPEGDSVRDIELSQDFAHDSLNLLTEENVQFPVDHSIESRGLVSSKPSDASEFVSLKDQSLEIEGLEIEGLEIEGLEIEGLKESDLEVDNLEMNDLEMTGPEGDTLNAVPHDELTFANAKGELEELNEDGFAVDLDISEAKIDLSDVMKMPNNSAASEPNSTAPILTSEDSLDEVIEPASEADEEAYEQILTKSISAQEQLIEDPAQDDQRNQTLGMIGDTATSLDDEYSTNIADGSLEELATADNEHHPKDLDEILDEDLNESLELKGLHLLPLSEIVTTKEKHKIDLSSDHADLGDGHTAELPVRHQWGFSGIDLDNTGHPVIGFANGVQITLTRECLESGSIQVGGHTINLTEVKGGLEIHLNGLKMFLPIAA